jgi:hypothetical protein
MLKKNVMCNYFVIFVSSTHLRTHCPSYKKAIKSFAMTCGYVVDGLGFYYIPHASSIKNRGDTKAALIRVIEGNMTAPWVTTEMERLVPGKVKWVVEDVRNNTFKTIFPSRNELQWMIKWGTVQTKDQKAVMVIEERDGSIKFKQAMRKI